MDVELEKENYKNTISIAYLLSGLSQFFELIFYYVLYRYLPVEQLGLYSWAMAIAAFFSILLNLGVEPILVRKFSQNAFHLIDAVPAFFMLRTPLIVLALILVQTLYWTEHVSFHLYSVLLLVGAWQVLSVTESVFLSWLKANRKQNITNAIAWLGSFGRLVSAFIVIIAFSIQSIAYLLVVLVAVKCMTLALAILVTYRQLRVLGYRNSNLIEKRNIYSISMGYLREGMVFTGITSLTVAQNRLDWLLVSNLISAASLASYALVNKFYEVFQMLIGISLTTLYPWLCRDKSRGNIPQDLSIMAHGLIAVGTAMSLSAMIVLPYIVTLLFKDKYSGLDVPIQIIMLSASLITACGIFYHVILSKGQESKILPVITISTIVQLILNLILIPKLGITGAALGMLILVLSTLVGYSIIMKGTLYSSKTFVRRILLFLILSVASSTLVVPIINHPITRVLAMFVIVMMISWMILFNREERDYLWAFSKRIFGYAIGNNRYA